MKMQLEYWSLSHHDISCDLTFEKHSSMGLKSGVVCRKCTSAPTWVIINTTPGTWWTEQLSMITTLLAFTPSKGINVGNRCFWMKSKNTLPSTVPPHNEITSLFMGVNDDSPSPWTNNVHDFGGFPLRQQPHFLSVSLQSAPVSSPKNLHVYLI